MKLPVIFLAVLGLACGASIPHQRNLQDDLLDFVALIPADQIAAIALDYMANDAEMQEILQFVQSEDFHKVVTTIEQLKEYEDFVKFMQSHSIDIVWYINQIHAGMGWGPYEPSAVHRSYRQARRGVGLNGFIDDVIAILPTEKLKALFQEKLETSTDFKIFYDTVRSSEFQSIVETLRSLPAYQELLQKLRNHGVDIEHYIELIRAMFGLNRNARDVTRDLQDDLNDFLDLVPVDQVLTIVLGYLSNDAQVQELLVYIQSDEFHKIVLTVEGLKEFSDFTNFLKVHGIDVLTIINTIHGVIGLPPFPESHTSVYRTGGVNGLIEDIIAVLPVDQLKALFQDKLASSPDFKAFYDAIGSPEFNNIVETLRDLPEYKELLETLRNYGIDVDYYIKLLRALFGLPSKSTRDVGLSRNLNDDLNDFLALIPVEKILPIALDYLSNDAEVEELLVYIQSDEFHKIVLTVEGLKEFSVFVSFLGEHGIDVATIINTIHGIIGLPPYSASRRFVRRTGGVNGLIEDIIAVLPVDQLKALFQEKLTTSADFKALYDAIRSPEFNNIVETLRALPEYKELLQTLRNKGVDVDYYIQLFRDLFGLDSRNSRDVSRNLNDDLNDFLALVPVDQVLTIALDYLSNDAQVQELLVYIQSDEFHKIVLTVEGLKEFNDFVIFLTGQGIDVNTIINTIHGIIGLPPKAVSRRHVRRTGGVNGLIDDIIAVLPVDELKALFQEKLTTSPDFKAFYESIGSPEFSNIVETLRALPEYKELLETLRNYGVDVDYYIKLLRTLFGLPSKSTRDVSRNLNDDLNDFLALIPVEKILPIALDYLSNDAEVQELLVYIQSDEFHKIVLTVEGLKEFSIFVSFLGEHGIDVATIINTIHGIIGLPPYSASRRFVRRTGGVNGLIEDIIAALPVDQLKALFQEKLTTSADFKALYDAIRSPEFNNIVETLRALPEYKELLQTLRNKGVDVDYYIQLFRDLFGLDSRNSRDVSRNLNDDLNDFLALVPVDQVLTIALDYLSNDAQVQELLVYIQSDEFHKIVLTVEGVKEFKDFVNFLSGHSIDVDTIINTIHGIIGLPPISVPRRYVHRTGGVNGLIEDIIAILPVDQLKALFQEKLTTSPDFKAFYDAIGSPEFNNIVETLRALPEYKELLETLRNYGVDVDYYIKLLRALFGLPSKSTHDVSRNLNDDLNDFLALIPVEKILPIALDYLSNDSEVQELLVYIQSDEFHKIVLTVEGLKEFSVFISFLGEHGIDVATIINTIHGIIGLPPYSAYRRFVRRTGGVNGLIEDIIAVLPVDQLKALFQEKLTTSADFKALYDAIRSPEFNNIVETLRALPEYKELLQTLRNKGVDVDYYIQLFRDLFGLDSRNSRDVSRNLNDDLNDFLALVPVDQVLTIALDYLSNDAQVQELLVYIQSDEFHKIVLTVEGLKEFNDFVNFLSGQGIDVDTIINTIHGIIGLPPKSVSRTYVHRTGGVNGLIEDIIAILPVDQLKALFQQKLTTSPDFKAFYNAIGSPEFNNIVETLRALPEYKELLENLRNYGVDVDYYIKLLRALFGLS